MIKLYLSYLIVGMCMLWLVLFDWGFSAGTSSNWPYVYLFSSAVMFTTASVFALYKPKVAAIIGVVTTLGLLQFVWYIIKDIVKGNLTFFGYIIIGLLLWYFVTAIISVSIALIQQPVSARKINKALLWILSALPPVLFTVWTISILVHFG